MGVADKMWDAITTVIKMNDKIERMAATMVSQQQKIENLTERIIRLETALELGLSQSRVKKPIRRIEKQDDGHA
ncbi:MAG: hypothetical protein Q8O37_12205 [Sulfuricellaceae bacterium]|nr:hypothetical protein [Sulfuricellaceae bacterium]